MVWDYRFSNYIYYGGNPFDTVYALRIDSVNEGYNIGDINGDGYDDIAMSGRSPSNWRMNVYYGGPSLDTIRDLFFGSDLLNPICHPVIKCLDLDSDGKDELVSRDNGDQYSLLLYELDENPDSLQDLIITPANISYDGYIFGEGLISGDFNGDGKPDLAASLRRSGQQHTNGSIYLYWGGPGFDTVPDMIIRRPGEFQDHYDFFGWILESLGDINGDGYGDFFAGAGATADTTSFIYFGGPNIDTIPDIIIENKFGKARSAGDLNGDAYNDLITSYPLSFDIMGDVYIYLGHPNMENISDFAIHNRDFPGWQTYFGLDCAGVGDFNGDGVNDFAFSAVNIWSRGEIFIYSGWTKNNDVEYEYEPSLPVQYILKQNYPNPFNPRTRIEYSLQKGCKIILEIYDALGQKVCVLEDGWKPAGKYSIIWDGNDDSGAPVSSGIYFYRLVAGEFTSTKKMVIIK